MEKILKEWADWSGTKSRLVAYDNGRIDYIVLQKLIYDDKWEVVEEFSSTNSVDMIVKLTEN